MTTSLRNSYHETGGTAPPYRLQLSRQEEFPLQNETNPRTCGVMEGKLPGSCAPMVFPYIPMQENSPQTYSQQEGLQNGTLFPGLNLPFFRGLKTRFQCDNQALCELMALDFAITELGLYLDTHRGDKDAFALFSNYVRLYREGKEKYEKQYGPLQQANTAAGGSYAWLSDPWPWDVEGGKA